MANNPYSYEYRPEIDELEELTADHKECTDAMQEFVDASTTWALGNRDGAEGLRIINHFRDRFWNLLNVGDNG